MKAGAFTPATPDTQTTRSEGRSSLNEGGGFHPRNPCGGGVDGHRTRRSMKPGAFTPATHVARTRRADAANVARSMKAGAFTPATLVRRTAPGRAAMPGYAQ